MSMPSPQRGSSDLLVVFGLVAAVIVGLLFLWPNYRVWQRELSGKAVLREAEWSRKVAIEEAKAKRESAALFADAEIERARGVAEANRIIADGLGGPEGYLRYLYIDALGSSSSQLVYVPTEAGLPVLEAGRFARVP